MIDNSLIVTSPFTIELRPAPINPDWIIDGQPTARNAVLSTSRDGCASTILWECTAGRFEWHYDIDETIHILDGSVVLQSARMPATRVNAGDVVFFKRGTRARWHVEGYVRKLAFCRRTEPAIVGLCRKVGRRLRAPFAAARGAAAADISLL